MFCSKCGQQLPDGSAFCSVCGAPQTVAAPQPAYQQPAQPVYQQPVYQQPAQPVYQQPVYQQPAQPVYQQPVYQQPMYQQATQPALPMKWFNFLIYFSLFAAAFLSLTYGFGYISGNVYMVQDGIEPHVVYDAFPALQWVDIFFGIYQLGFAVFCVVSRQLLAHYKTNGPRLLLATYLVNLAASLLYGIANIIILNNAGVEVDAAYIFENLFGTLIIPLFFYFYNRAYFSKRAHLFVN